MIRLACIVGGMFYYKFFVWKNLALSFSVVVVIGDQMIALVYFGYKILCVIHAGFSSRTSRN